MINKEATYNPKVYKVIVKGIIKPFLSLRGGVELIGQENLDDIKGPCILAPTHQSMWDIPALALAFSHYTDENIRFVGKDDLWESKIPFLRRLLDTAGAIPVNRSNELQPKTINHIKSIIEANGILGIFPQGTRTEDIQRKDIKRGIAQLALMFGLDIVPVGIAGTRTGNNSSTNIVVSFGQPIYVEKSHLDSISHNLDNFRRVRGINDILYERLLEAQSLAVERSKK